jgi:hypothetical protein
MLSLDLSMIRYANEHEDIFDTENSERAYEEEVMLTGFGEAPVKTKAPQSFTTRRKKRGRHDMSMRLSQWRFL